MTRADLFGGPGICRPLLADASTPRPAVVRRPCSVARGEPGVQELRVLDLVDDGDGQVLVAQGGLAIGTRHRLVQPGAVSTGPPTHAKFTGGGETYVQVTPELAR